MSLLSFLDELEKDKRTEYLSSLLRIIRVERNSERDRWKVGPMAGAPIVDNQKPYSSKIDEMPVHKEHSWKKPTIYPLKVGYVNKLVEEGVLNKSGKSYNLSIPVNELVSNMREYEDDIHPSFTDYWEELKEE